MPDSPWLGDACSLVDAFRSGERSPEEEAKACLAAIEASDLNAFSFLDAEAALDAARSADVSLPFGGVPIGIKELDKVKGWPATEGSVALKDKVATYDSTSVARLRAAGSVFLGMTTSSEFGGVNLTRTRLNGITHNPWNPERTPGGSSGGAASAVAGGLIPIGTGGDGGGSIRIPAGFCGLVGLKHTYGRTPKGPGMYMGSMTAVPGCLARSVRDAARWLDVTNGYDPHDPYSLPKEEGFEAGIGSVAVRGLKVAVAIDLGGSAVVHPDVAATLEAAAAALIADAGLVRTDVSIALPSMDTAWALSGTAEIFSDLGDRWPECADQLTPQIRFILEIAEKMYDIKSRAQLESRRSQFNDTMAAIFDQVDLVICATNPDVAFSAAGPLPTQVGERDVPIGNNGALTIPGNIHGNPGVSIPVGTVDGLPVGMQIMTRHRREDILIELAAIAERERPWALVAPGVAG
ncbi:MAG: amidase [Acidimicrobiales bacterium]